MPVSDLPNRSPDEWTRATTHSFLAAVRDGSIPRPAFDAWLVQDHHFVGDLLRFQARLLARAPRQAQPVLAAGAVALVDELAWFEQHAGARGLDLTAARLPATAAYAELLHRLDCEPVPAALAALWAIERIYLDAWSFARPGAEPYREFVEHWTTPEFGAYVDALADAADAELATAGLETPADPVVAAVVAAECAFWDMAMTATTTGRDE